MGDTALDLYVRDYEELAHDPVRWAETLLRVHLLSYQQAIMRDVLTHRRVAVRSGHGVGKSFLSAVLTLAYTHTTPGAIAVTTAPTARQVRNVLWREIRRLHSERLAPLGAPGRLLQTALWLDDAQSWGAFGFTSNDSNQAQGLHAEHVLIVVDEAPGVSREILTALLTVAANEDSHVLMIGNPTEAAGPFYDAFRSESWVTHHISCFDSPAFSGEQCPEAVKRALVGPQYVEDAKRDWGEDSAIYQSRVLGEFPVEGDDTVIPLAWVERAVAREAPVGGSTRPVLGVDVARFGADRTVCIMLTGDAARIVDVAGGRDTMATVGRILDLHREHGFAAIAVDDIGVGGGVTDRLREMGAPVVPVNVADPAIDADRFANRRAELWWVAREWIRDTAVLPDDPALVADLTAPRSRYTSRGKVQLERKEETKKRLGHSPDMADALILALSMRGAYPTAVYDDGVF